MTSVMTPPPKTIDPILALEAIDQRYGSSRILRSLSMSIPKSQLTVVLGANGVGKTSLMKAIMGVVPISAGSILFEGQAIHQYPPHLRVRAGIGYVPQGREIFPRLSVYENLIIAARSPKEAAEDLDTVVSLFPVLKQMSRRKGGDLSGGQQQQLAIGRALMGRPRLLILDDPTEGIQPNIIQMIGDTLRQLVDQQGITVLLVEQYFAFARALADQFFILRKGEVVAQGDRLALQSEGIEKHMLAGH
jgi:urea transport system ATP-binding protein